MDTGKSSLGEFARRHIGPQGADLQAMLDVFEASSCEDFLTKVVPDEIRLAQAPELPVAAECSHEAPALSERDAIAVLQRFARMNGGKKSMLGLGYYNSHMPAPIQRRILENPAWYTAYTPYQAEISQGRLEMLLNFQTMVSNLCGLPVANASLLDEATAAAEAMTLLLRSNKNKDRRRFLVEADMHPQTLAVLSTRAQPLGVELVLCKQEDNFIQEGAFGALLCTPTSSGQIADRSELIARLAAANVKTALCTDLLALCLLKSPGEMGASIAIGSSQRFGLPLGAGGPHAAYFACEQQCVRYLPGRIVGISRDSKGRPALRLALQTREQHIRRDKATSNICTAQVLPAVLAAAYAVYHGAEGLRAIARHSHQQACKIAASAQKAGVSLAHNCFFDTLRLKVSDAERLKAKLATKGVEVLAQDGMLGISCDETTTDKDVALIVEALNAELVAQATQVLPAALLRHDEILPQPVFARHVSEHAFMRYIQKLASRDIALDRSMIPLGSCTMKLNAATEMVALSWPEFSCVHPFSSSEDQTGIIALAKDLGNMLTTITGFDAITLQPNAGSQGEYCGLLAICGYHRARGEAERNICLVPESAHGTNPASAVMAGLQVVTVSIDANGEIDMADLQAKAEQHRAQLAALMVTYPSTCGIYSPQITKICDLIHDCGGQIYMDGANMNALVGIAQPGQFGADIMHINLHKTFCIPHGGGGPGMGPVVCKKHLQPYLPGHFTAIEGSRTDGAVSAAPLGSALLLTISWAYMRMMGAQGLREASAVAVLSANYMAKRLSKHYDLAFTDAGGYCAHEFVIDARAFKKPIGITVEDIAKRLIDMGFHAPTISFPVVGSLMVEPAESEPKEEIDRFCDALIVIREEIDRVERNEWDPKDNPLVNAPHVAADLLASDHTATYSRETAAYPLPWITSNKYWPPVSRIDQVFGDRNLRCTLNPDEELD